MTDAAKPRTFLRRVLRGTVRLSFTLAVLAGAGFAVQQGALVLSQRAEAAAPPPEAPPLPVETRPITMEDGYLATRRFVGQVEAAQASALSFEFGGLVVEILVDEGDVVEAGQVIARLDTALLHTDLARLEAARTALEADLDFARLSVARREALQERGFSPEEALDQARFSEAALSARIAEVEAQIAAVEVRIDKALLTAPYAGRIAARLTDTGATVGGGQTIVDLLETRAAQVRVGLPLWVEAAPGTEWPIAIDGIAAPVNATVAALRPDIDPTTRTRTALLALDAADVPYGSTATVAVPRFVAARGTWIPIEALREGAPGVWTILVVDPEGIVRDAPIEVLHTEADRLFVGGGVAEGLSLVTGGPHRVVPGQHVAEIGQETGAE